jgi:hypothetical protein
LRSVFGSIKTPPHHKQLEYSAFYEVVFDDTSFRAEFLHGLGRTETHANIELVGVSLLRGVSGAAITFILRPAFFVRSAMFKAGVRDRRRNRHS